MVRLTTRYGRRMSLAFAKLLRFSSDWQNRSNRMRQTMLSRIQLQHPLSYLSHAEEAIEIFILFIPIINSANIFLGSQASHALEQLILEQINLQCRNTISPLVFHTLDYVMNNNSLNFQFKIMASPLPVSTLPFPFAPVPRRHRARMDFTKLPVVSTRS